MPRPLPTVFHIASQVMESDKAWMLFLEIPSKFDAGKVFRLVHGLKVVTANGHRWQPTSMKITLPGMSMEGDLGGVSVEIPNVLRVAASWVEAQDEVVGAIATVWLQHQDVFASGFIRACSWRQRVLQAEITEDTLVLQAGRRARTRWVPAGVYDRTSFPQLSPAAGQSVVGTA
jgi:hypothetical protein